MRITEENQTMMINLTTSEILYLANALRAQEKVSDSETRVNLTYIREKVVKAGQKDISKRLIKSIRSRA